MSAALKTAFAPRHQRGRHVRAVEKVLDRVIRNAEVSHVSRSTGIYQLHWTRRERKAASVLNALRHSIIYRLDIAEEIHSMRRGAAIDTDRLVRMIGHRRTAWRIYRALLAEYRAAKGEA